MCGYLQQLQGLAVMQKSVECEGPQCHTAGCSLVLLSYTVLNIQPIILHFSTEYDDSSKHDGWDQVYIYIQSCTHCMVQLPYCARNLNYRALCIQ